MTIRDLIVSGDLSAGSKIPEKELCFRYGVSRTPLREALKVLAIEGLVVLETNRGAKVSQITRGDLDDVFPVMGALEALAGELACLHMSTIEIEHVRVLHNKMVQHFRLKQLYDYFVINEQIHEAILFGSRNHTLCAQYRSLAARVRRARYLANMTETRWEQATAEHEKIIELLEARDGLGLATVLRKHLSNKVATVREWLDTQPHDV